jgi:hypothetical protein
VQADVVEEHLQVGQQPVAALRGDRQRVDVGAVVLEQAARDLRRLGWEGVTVRKPTEARAREAEAFFVHCGACRIELTVERGERADVNGSIGLSEPRWGFKGGFKARRTAASARSTVIEAAGFEKPRRFVRKDWLWANAETDWLDVRRKRLASHIQRHQLITEVEDQRQLSGDAKARLAKVASVQVGGSKEIFEATKWANSTNLRSKRRAGVDLLALLDVADGGTTTASMGLGLRAAG